MFKSNPVSARFTAIGGVRSLLLLLLLLLSTSDATSASGGQLFERMPQETFRLTLQLTDAVQHLRQQEGVQGAWPEVVVHGRKDPRHAYIKALEVLSKINRYRVIHQMGAVEVSIYPSREITADAVFDLVQRLVAEVTVLLAADFKTIDHPDQATTVITRADNYRQLWRISRAFDPLLGVRGFAPAEVFAASEQIVGMVRFLRISQHLTRMPEKPDRLINKHPNHALAAAYHLLARIGDAERNLWMEPVAVPVMKKRVISPTEVYDALQGVSAELLRIQWRLGLEHALPMPAPRSGATPDDVIQNLQWATAAMPRFPFDRMLVQYNSASLAKNPDDVFAIADAILQKLKYYKKTRGIRIKAKIPSPSSGLKPRHAYHKTLECLSKVEELHRQAGFAASAVPQFPMRRLTPDDTFMLVSRLDRALNLVYASSQIPMTGFAVKAFSGKTPSDVFDTLWQISYQLDTILGSQGEDADDVLPQVRFMVDHIKLLGRSLHHSLRGVMPPLQPDKEVTDGIAQARELLKRLKAVRLRAGMFNKMIPLPLPLPDAEPTADDLYNIIAVISAELINIEVHFGISEQLAIPARRQETTDSEVYQQLGFANALLTELLGGHHE
ncbi:MAG: hypothetical protein R8J84_03980 [Mariprofundales bacterium]